MSDKEQFLKYLKYCTDEENIGDIIVGFILENQSKIEASSLLNLITNLNGILTKKVDQLEIVKLVCWERGTYLCDYLEGKTWATEEDAKKNLQPQIENAKMIVDVCKRK